MIKEWYLQIGGNKEGPYSIAELKNDRRITPETLVWKKGFAQWLPIGKVKELQEVFKDEEELPEQETPNEAGQATSIITPDGLVLDFRCDPPRPIIWVIFILLLILYIFYKFL